MCGIAGFSLSTTDNITVNSKRLARELLLGIEHRGTDATGFAFIDTTGQAQVHKRDIKASDFVSRRLTIPKRVQSAVLHTRFATQGDPIHNENNHPLLSGSVVGVHNGWLTNEDRLWGDMVSAHRRKAEVDSEVIFALLAHGYKDSGATIIDSLEAIKGNAAVAWLDTDAPDKLFLARGSSSPLFVGQTVNGSTVFASEEDVVVKACIAAGLELTHVRDINEGQLLIVREGDIEDVATFKPTSGYRTYGRTGSYGNAYTHGGWESWDDEYEYGSFTREQDKFAKGYKSAADSAKVFLESQDIEGEDEDQCDWWSPSYMSMDYFDTSKDVPFLDEDAYRTAYAERELLISEWFSGWKGDYDQMLVAAKNLRAFVRPGDYVTTMVAGVELEAEVVVCPATWPNGNYTLRCITGRRQATPCATDNDVVLVTRHFSQFWPKGTTPYGTRRPVQLAITA